MTLLKNLCVLCVVFLPAFCTGLAAEELPALPEAVQPYDRGEKITGTLANRFREIIPRELYPLTSSGEFGFNSVKNRRFSWRLDDAWEEASVRNLESKAGEQLPEQLISYEGFLFGRSADIDADQDPESKAQKILWNIKANFHARGYIETDLRINWLASEARGRFVESRFFRFFPNRIIENYPAKKQYSRELLGFTFPALLRDMKYLGFSFFGELDDALWLHSPAINQTRQLTAANRKDSILNSSLALDDLFVWSGKIGSHQARVKSEGRFLIPSGPNEFGRLDSDKQGCHIMNAPQGVLEEARGSTPTFLGPAEPMPSGIVFFPADVWRVELQPGDPYSQYGTQVLYVDKDMMLPVYKFVYDRAGRHWKSVIGVFGLAFDRTSGKKVPYPIYSLLIDHKKQQRFSVTHRYVRYCSKLPQGVLLSKFDPKGLAPPTPAPSAAPEKPEQVVPGPTQNPT